MCSTWESFHIEIERLKQVLTNNNFPMAIIDEQINKFLRNKMQANTSTDEIDKISFFFKGQMSATHKIDEKRLQSIVAANINATEENKQVKLLVY